MGKKLSITQKIRKENPNIDFDDFQFKKGTHTKMYRGECPACKNDRGYISSKSRWSSLCRSCNGVRSGSINMKGKDPHNKCKKAPLDQRIKQSCSHRNIDVKDFDDFLHIDKKRHDYNNSKLRQQCFNNANHTCDAYGVVGVELNTHHLDCWHKNKDKRFCIDNIVCLSVEAHKTFHYIYGNKDNTAEQYQEFKSTINQYRQTKQVLFLIAGCSGSGKSWVCDKLKNKFNYVSYDNVNKNHHIYELLKNNSKPILYDPTVKVSTFIKRYSHLFDIRLIVINEDELTITNRILQRNGKITDAIKKRIKRMHDLSKNCEFSGTSDQVLNYLINK